MSQDGSVTRLIGRAKQGDEAAVESLWNRYFPQLVRLARQKLQDVPRRMADEEDVALSVLNSAADALEHGKVPDLADRRELWRLLVKVTACKAIDLARRERRQRRGGGRVRGESVFGTDDPEAGLPGLAEIIDRIPTPEFAAMTAEQCRLLLDRLAETGLPNLQAIAVAKMEGYSNAEIARRLDCSETTIRRRLDLIRKEWKGELKQ